MFSIKEAIFCMQRSTTHNRILTVSNLLTGSRFILTPMIVVALRRNEWGSALWLLCIAGISDLLDGFIARLLNEPTWLGSILDPIADKALVVCTLGAFFMYSTNILLPAWFVLIIVTREALLLAGGTLLYFMKPSFFVQPSWFGKVSTFLILTLMVLVLLGATYNWPLTGAINTLMFTTLLCSGISFIQYVTRGTKYFILTEGSGF